MHKIPPSTIGFEIPETAVIANLHSAVNFIKQVRQLGAHVALDDFGAGLSTFSYLKQIPADYLKIDGSFVRNMLDDTMDHAIVDAINRVGHVKYQVDVAVTSSHMASHVTSAEALRCVNNKGNVASFSEYSSRRIHLLCWDEHSQTLYDVIITRINRFVKQYENPKSELVTAYAPEGVQGTNLFEKMNFYIAHLKNTVGGKVVNLHFNPGEVMFIPK